MADMAVRCMDMWNDLEKDAGTTLRLMTGLLNFGDKDLGQGTPEGTPRHSLISDGILTISRNTSWPNPKSEEAQHEFQNVLV